MIMRRDGHRVLITVPVRFGRACVLVRSPGETERKGVLREDKNIWRFVGSAQWHTLLVNSIVRHWLGQSIHLTSSETWAAAQTATQQL